MSEPTQKEIKSITALVEAQRVAYTEMLGGKTQFNRFLAILKDTLATETVKLDDKTTVYLGSIKDPVTQASIVRAIGKACYYGLSIGRATGESWLVQKGAENGHKVYQLFIGRTGYLKKAKESGLVYDARVIPLTFDQWNSCVVRQTNNGDAFTVDTSAGKIKYQENGRMEGVQGYLVELIVPGSQPNSRRSEIVIVPATEIKRICTFAKVGTGSAWEKFSDKMDEKIALVVAIKPKFFGTPFFQAVQEQDDQEHDYEQAPRIDADRFTKNLDGRVKELGGEDAK
jgi:recombinational DNA repair protein RecT